MNPRAALLILDFQVGLFHGPEPLFEKQRLLDNLNRLIAKARAADAPIFAVRHTGPEGSPIAQGSPFWQLAAELEINPAHDRVFDKTAPSAFLGTDFANQLAAAEVGQLVIAGLKTQYCVDTNCRAAAALGWRPVLVSDAHSCSDTPVLGAREIIAHHNLTLGGPFARVAATGEVVF
ncbi:cysteine hydrolase family protein [Pseudomonas sp. dw_358]|uniref:cysteine hydrolase family protein n=1 Tax=Pseudomonas sp. dw_358 TaxID=2720083 RepID=UPI001BD58F36|nr:cysteine hydrolase family protein [Pseudomonas sp. dw_358]